MTEAPTLRWDAVGRAEWDRLLRSAGRSALEQGWAYGEAHRGVRARRGVATRNGEPVAMVQVLERRFRLGLCLAQIIRGPVWLGVPAVSAVLSAIKAEYRLRAGKLLVWAPELPDDPQSEALMRAAGLRRMATGYSSAWIDLGLSADELCARMRRKWRNKLAAGERGGLIVQVRKDDRHLGWLLQRYDAHRRKQRYSAPSGAVMRPMAESGDFLTLRALLNGQPVAGALMTRHGASATYAVGWTDEAGRHARAQNLLLWRAMLELKARGADWLDIGGINAAAPGVARFKMGLGGEFFTLTGTYI